MKTDENFPVASLLIRAELRATVRDFYRFARAADDVADAPDLSRDAKLARLDAFAAGLKGDSAGAEEARTLRARLSSEQRGALVRHAELLLVAFRQDARGFHYRTWEDLLSYCAHSANPVGRFLLDLHVEGPATHGPSDALCTALQVLNHLQDIRDDHDRIARVYLPSEWLEAEGVPPAALSGAALTPGLRRVIDRALDRCDALLVEARTLPAAIRAPRLAGEARTIVHLGHRLSARLRAGDPLAGRVKPSRLDFARAGALGLARALRPVRGRTASVRERA
ncbi:squalene/phytoene synthase family protein [Tranquillimonas alkanivorans]|uniref:Squalene synthase HpnC n=1 Tax=Tranquillimonas alkanivorans TaxID=441119 RepID=A0A1I5QT63_9RHOB|nr:squalene/phytoene synthase family protein [Tranquillimonas alkanivorans]SFP49231.1 squalene synthase HpnC [Tranquillimonas alkanivorans]